MRLQHMIYYNNITYLRLQKKLVRVCLVLTNYIHVYLTLEDNVFITMG